MHITTTLLVGIILLMFLWVIIVDQKQDPRRSVAKVRKNGTVAWIERELDEDNLDHTFMRIRGEAMIYRLPLNQDNATLPFKVGDEVTITYDDHFPSQLLSIKAHPGDQGL